MEVGTETRDAQLSNRYPEPLTGSFQTDDGLRVPQKAIQPTLNV